MAPLIAPLASFASGLTARGVLTDLALGVGIPLAADYLAGRSRVMPTEEDELLRKRGSAYRRVY